MKTPSDGGSRIYTEREKNYISMVCEVCYYSSTYVVFVSVCEFTDIH